jgi:hypothetical protein
MEEGNTEESKRFLSEPPQQKLRNALDLIAPLQKVVSLKGFFHKSFPRYSDLKPSGAVLTRAFVAAPFGHS